MFGNLNLYLNPVKKGILAASSSFAERRKGLDITEKRNHRLDNMQTPAQYDVQYKGTYQECATCYLRTPFIPQ